MFFGKNVLYFVKHRRDIGAGLMPRNSIACFIKKKIYQHIASTYTKTYENNRKYFEDLTFHF